MASDPGRLKRLVRLGVVAAFAAASVALPLPALARAPALPLAPGGAAAGPALSVDAASSDHHPISSTSTQA